VQSFREAERSLPRMALKSMNRMIGSKWIFRGLEICNIARHIEQRISSARCCLSLLNLGNAHLKIRKVMKTLQETRWRIFETSQNYLACLIDSHWILATEIVIYLSIGQTNNIRLAALCPISNFKVNNLESLQKYSEFPSLPTQQPIL
jgi:hypothetical protein